MITDNCDEFKTSVKCGILLIFVIYAQTPNSAKPDPPMVIGNVERAVAAEVAINDWKNPTFSPTACANTRNERP